MKADIVVVGSLNTDIIISGVKDFPKPGQQVYADELKIDAGGKSRNIAQMIAVLTQKGKVAMIGKSIKDPYNFWLHPINSLKKAGVNIDNVKILEYGKVNKLPGIAVIPVDKNGNNSIYVIPGINDNFSKEDIDEAREAIANSKYAVITFERPMKTALYAIKVASSFGAKVLVDPGGISEAKHPKDILRNKLFLLKPNEHEAKILTGVVVKDFASAKQAAKNLLSNKIENILITHGKNGAYFFNKNIEAHIKIPKVRKSLMRDETGCGDQTIAALTSSLSDGKDILSAVRMGILAGTLQFYKAGINPVTKKELLNYIKRG